MIYDYIKKFPNKNNLQSWIKYPISGHVYHLHFKTCIFVFCQRFFNEGYNLTFLVALTLYPHPKVYTNTTSVIYLCLASKIVTKLFLVI